MKSPRTIVVNSFKDIELAYRRLWDDTYNISNKDFSVTGTLTLVGVWIYLGDEDTDGTWRIGKDLAGTSLLTQRREAGTYVSKGGFTA